MILSYLDHLTAVLYVEYDFVVRHLVAFDCAYNIHWKETITLEAKSLPNELLCYMFFECYHVYIIDISANRGD